MLPNRFELGEEGFKGVWQCRDLRPDRALRSGVVMLFPPRLSIDVVELLAGLAFALLQFGESRRLLRHAGAKAFEADSDVEPRRGSGEGNEGGRLQFFCNQAAATETYTLSLPDAR